MKHPVVLRIPYPSDADGGDAVQVYSDFGSGTIDTTRPLLPVPVPLFPGRTTRFSGLRSVRLGRTGFAPFTPPPLRAADMASVIHGVTPYPPTTPYREVVVMIPPGFGDYQFQARLTDENGNEQAANFPAITAIVSATTPPTMRRIELGGYDPVGDAVTIDYLKNTE